MGDKMCAVESKDTETLINIFPPEIWLKILEEADSKAIIKLQSISIFFYDLIVPLRSRLLLSEVLSNVLKHLSEDKTKQKILLTCRLACRPWNRSVIRFVQHKLRDFVENKKSGEYCPAYLGTFSVTLENNGIVADFASHFKASHLSHNKNPFAIQGIKVDYYTPYPGWYDSDETRFEQMEDLLSKFGHNILHCHLHGYLTAPQTRQILSLLPNLQTLTVDLQEGTNYCHRDLVHKPPVSLLPFPKYANLRCVKVTGYNVYDIFHALVTNNRHVKHLEEDCSYILLCQTFFLNPMPNLTKLKLTCKNLTDIQRLESIVHVWPLKSFGINMRCFTNTASWQQIGRCFNALEDKFGETLENLEIMFPWSMEEYRPPSYALNLPKLTSIYVHFLRPQKLDFILPVRDHLKILNVDVITGVSGSVEENVAQFSSADINFLDANFCNVFPRLENVTLGTFYTQNYNKTKI